jgi:photosystem II stability/assembly factor-like uncharacterized protein
MRNLIIILGFLTVINLYSENKNPFINENIKEGELKDFPLERDKDFIDQRAYPFNEIPIDGRQKALRQLDRMKNSKQNASILAVSPDWLNIGPFEIGGRVKTIAPHPTNQKEVYIGAAAGGIWKTTDAGDNWTPIFDFENAISFGSISIDKNNPLIIYAATGEPVSGGGNIYLGAGVFKSTDGGQNWFNIGLTDVGAFSKIYCHPKNSNILYAGGMLRGQGVYKSINAGKTWTKLYSGQISDLTINNNNVDELMIGIIGQGVYYSNDGGATFTDRNNGITAGMGKVSVQIAQSNPATAYTLMENADKAYIFKTTDSGANWTFVYSGDASFFNGQGFYDNFICVNPQNSNHVLAGGIDVFVTTDGGSYWYNSTKSYSGGSVHPDQHCAAFSQSGDNLLYLGDDGGMYRSNDGASSWYQINNNLQITQFYSLAIDNKNKSANYGGTQDNGTLGTSNNANWNRIYGGDGFQTLVDVFDSEIIYGEVATTTNVGVRIYPWKRDLGTGAYNLSSNGIDISDASLWNPPLIQDYNTDYLYHGRQNLYISYDLGSSWDILISANGGSFSSIEPSKANSDVLWAGTNTGSVFISFDGLTTFNNITENGLVNRFVTDIESSYKDDAVCYVSFSGYGTPHLYKTTDYGETWKVVSNGLPDIPINTVAIHPDFENRLFVGTDIGVFASYDDGQSWFPYGNKLPRSPVMDLAFHTNKVVLPQRTLRAATHGRSMWEIPVSDEAITEFSIVSPVGGEIFYSATNQVISWYGFNLPVSVYWSFDNGDSWNLIADKVNGNSLLWAIPNFPTSNAKIKVISNVDSKQEKISNSFTIKLIDKGTVMKNSSVSFIPYGIAWDGKNGLWVTSFQTNKLYKLNSETFYKEKSIELKFADSLFTDLSYDKVNNVIYLHRMNSTTSGGGSIYKIDTNGVSLKKFDSPAKYYPIGMELVDGKLIVGDRDTKRNLYVINPETGTVEATYKNPFDVNYGPRGLCYDGKNFLYQVSTAFPSGSLTGAFILKINKNDLSSEVERFNLEGLDGIINGRGVDYDSRDKNFWVSDYGGNIYKIAGFETVAGVEDGNLSNKLDISFYPNPASEFINIGFNAIDAGDYEISIYSIINPNIGINFKLSMSNDESFNKSFSLNNLLSGSYVIELKKNNKMISREKLMIVK